MNILHDALTNRGGNERAVSYAENETSHEGNR